MYLKDILHILLLDLNATHVSYLNKTQFEDNIYRKNAL